MTEIDESCDEESGKGALDAMLRPRHAKEMIRSLFTSPEKDDDKHSSAKSPRKQSRVEKTVRKLIRLAMDAEDGAYLGSEIELLEKLEVSRPTLRQAAKIVASDQLLEIRRGVNGGFFSRRPDARHVVQGPAFFLRLAGASLDHALVANSVIASTIAAEAAKSRDQKLISQMQDLLERLQAVSDSEFDHRALFAAELDLVSLAAKMADNPVLQLYQQIGYEFGQLERNLVFFIDHPRRCAEWKSLQSQYCQALLHGDSEMAQLISARRSRAIEKWLKTDSPAERN